MSDSPLSAEGKGEANPKFKRVLLKLSGECLAGETGCGISPSVLSRISREIKEVHDLGVETAIVIGGGNIFRGVEGVATQGIDRAQADYMGMLATVINGMALQGALENLGCYTRLMSAIEMKEVAEPFIPRRAVRHLEKGRIVIFAAGTGNPFFTTDTAAVLRATQIGAEVILKGTDVDGVFDSDPETNPNALRFAKVDYLEVLKRGLKVMDATAISLSMDQRLPIIVFNMEVPGNIRRAIMGESIGTIVE